MLLIWPLEKMESPYLAEVGKLLEKKKKKYQGSQRGKSKGKNTVQKIKGGKKTPKKPKSFLKLDNGTSPKGNQPGNLGNRESYSNILKIESEFN